MADTTDDVLVVEYRFTRIPDRIEFGAAVVCYRCHGKGTDPDHRKSPCRRCGGLGVIPNKGSVP
jgi:DnaJ-class molecular chaperone